MSTVRDNRKELQRQNMAPAKAGGIDGVLGTCDSHQLDVIQSFIQMQPRPEVGGTMKKEPSRCLYFIRYVLSTKRR